MSTEEGREGKGRRGERREVNIGRVNIQFHSFWYSKFIRLDCCVCVCVCVRTSSIAIQVGSQS